MRIIKTISNPSIEINSKIISYIANSAKYIIEENADTGSIQHWLIFDMFVTTENIALVREWKTNNNGSHVINIAQDDFCLTMKSTSLNDPVIPMRGDSEIELKFCSLNVD